MKFELKRNSIEMTPEDCRDVAFVEDTLGLKKEGDEIPFRRIAGFGMPHTIAYIEARKEEK